MSPSPSPPSTTAAPALPSLHPPPLPRAPYRLSPSSSSLHPPSHGPTSGRGPWPGTTASSRRHRQPDARAANREIGDPDAHTRHRGAHGPQDRRYRGSPCGLRAGGGGASWRWWQATGTPERLPVRVEGGGGRREAAGRAGEGRWMEGREGSGAAVVEGGDGEGDITDAGNIPGPSEDRGPRQMLP